MKIEEKNVILKKLIASEGKVLREKEIQYDEDGNEIERTLAKIIYLPENADESLYEEIDEE